MNLVGKKDPPLEFFFETHQKRGEGSHGSGRRWGAGEGVRMRRGKKIVFSVFFLFCRMTEEVVKAHAWWIKRKGFFLFGVKKNKRRIKFVCGLFSDTTRVRGLDRCPR